MVRNVFRLDDRQISSLMIPRGDIVYLDVSESIERNLTLVAESYHSRSPVCRNGFDELLGLVTAKQLFNQMQKSGQANITEQLKPRVFVPDTLPGMELHERTKVV